jgi:predicted GIY-YIG superfamily endonuclease/Pyruvate/2-oxoacid:ferredoxin oxidoreductase delta subunit
MRETKYTEEYIRELAKECITLKKFRDNHYRAWMLARRLGIIDDLNLIRCETGITYWPENRIREVASKYTSLSKFCKGDYAAWRYAGERGIRHDLGFIPTGNRMKRCVYVFEFKDNHAYIGLTWNAENRKNQHLLSDKSPVYIHQDVCRDYEFIIKEDYMPCKDAQKYERFYIDKYRENGWIVLNRNSGGTPGGRNSKITDDMIREEGRKYKTRVELIKNNASYYQLAWKRGLLDELYGSRYVQYDMNAITKIASNYKNRDNFKAEHPSLYGYLYKCEKLDELFPIKYNRGTMFKKPKIYKKDIKITDNTNINPIHIPQRQRYNIIYPIFLD